MYFFFFSQQHDLAFRKEQHPDSAYLLLTSLLGQPYTVTVSQVVSIVAGEVREVTSEPVSAVFTTKPLAPREITTEQEKIIISPSPSPSVKYIRQVTNSLKPLCLPRFYKVKYKSSEEGSKAEEIIITKDVEGSLTISLKVRR